MFRKLGMLLALASAIATTQLPLGVLQACAWVDMFADYVVETGSVETSIEWTFDGHHRCVACDFVTEQVSAGEEQPETSFSDRAYVKLLLVPLVVESPIVESPPVVGEIIPDASLLVSEVADTVTPPPRFC
ncbi:MAG: hypothetical protein VB980_05740 [Opitutales bacterium]